MGILLTWPISLTVLESQTEVPPVYLGPNSTGPVFASTRLDWSLYDYMIHFFLWQSGQIITNDDYCQGPTEIKSNNRFVWALNFRDGETLICDHIEQASPPSSPDCLSGPSPGSPAGGLLRNGIENIPPSPSKEPPLKKR